MSETPVSGIPIVVFAGECDRGAVHSENQDAILHSHINLGDLLIVADGMGGPAGGATAARLVVKNFYAHMASLPRDYPVEEAIREASERANAEIYAASHVPGVRSQPMGSTVVMALLQQDGEGERAWIGHIGDSRAYLGRAGRLYQLTKDHSAVQDLIDRSLIAPEDARNHPDASILSRSLGHRPKVEIEIDQCDMGVGDSLLLCSDGLWGCVPERDMQELATDTHLPLETAAGKLLDLALAAGGHDNIGIELARLIMPSAEVTEQQEVSLAGIGWILVLFLFILAIVFLWTYFPLLSF